MKQQRSFDSSSPPIVIDAALYERLRATADAATRSAPDVAERLLEEIERAEIVTSDAMPADVVSIGSIVTYRDVETGSTRTIELAWPGDADPRQQRFSVVSPIGAALIGLSIGQTMNWQVGEGERRQLTVLNVSTRERMSTAPSL
jgi:regulator of nucleoside diphosphate kinase